MINIVGGFQRKAIELINNVNKIIKIRSSLDLRKVVFNNRVYLLFVVYIFLTSTFQKYHKKYCIDRT